MIIPYILLSTLVVFLNSIELSFQADLPGTSRRGSSYSPERPHSPVSSSPPTELHLHSRSRSPPETRPSFLVFGVALAEIGSIRLMCKRPPNWEFEIRRYTFPQDQGIHLLFGDNKTVQPIPTSQRLVLVTTNGEVVALLDRNNTMLRAIYKLRIDVNYGSEVEKRVKINFRTGLPQDMTVKEKHSCPLIRGQPILDHYAVVHLLDR